MTDQHDRFRQRLALRHGELFSGTRYEAEFFNYSGGAYDPDEGEITGESRTSIGTAQVELVPPGMDTTVDVDGTSSSWDTSIRLPTDTGLVSDFVPLGEDNERPTEVEISDQVENDTDTYELHAYSEERGSGMVMCRLVEQ
jgi:hypothetical protein